MGCYHAYRSGPPEGELRCAVRGEVVDDSKTLCDISLTASDGAVVSELRGVELHRRPELAPGGSKP